jgi:spore coat polysaccharide biosynthesis protein SpsF
VKAFVFLVKKSNKMISSGPQKRVVVFVQARLGSTRLPAKVLREVLGKELLLHEIERIRKAKSVDEVVVITTTKKEDDRIANLCKKNDIPYFRGSEKDLLDRHYQAAKKFKADFVVKIPSDCPIVDPKIIDEVINLWLNNQDKFDYVSNYHEPTFPDGLDVEGCPFLILEIAWREAKKTHEREHTFPFIWDNPKRFRLGNIENPKGKMFMTHRWTLDYEEDFIFLKEIIESFRDKPDFSMDDVLQLLNKNTLLKEINSKYNGVNWYRHHPGELKTVGEDLYRPENNN